MILQKILSNKTARSFCCRWRQFCHCACRRGPRNVRWRGERGTTCRTRVDNLDVLPAGGDGDGLQYRVHRVICYPAGLSVLGSDRQD